LRLFDLELRLSIHFLRRLLATITLLLRLRLEKFVRCILPTQKLAYCWFVFLRNIITNLPERLILVLVPALMLCRARLRLLLWSLLGSLLTSLACCRRSRSFLLDTTFLYIATFLLFCQLSLCCFATSP
jgi:hypothetical protein